MTLRYSRKLWEKNLKKSIYIYICITDLLYYTTETNTTLQINYAPIKIFKN